MNAPDADGLLWLKLQQHEQKVEILGNAIAALMRSSVPPHVLADRAAEYCAELGLP